MKKNVNAAELAAGQRTICEHDDVIQPDGSIARFHCRVAAPALAASPQIGNADVARVTIACATTNAPVKAPGLVERLWRGLVGKP